MPHNKGKIKYAKLESSPRLQRLHNLLLSGNEYTTLDIIKMAGIAAVSTAITELRRNLEIQNSRAEICCRIVSDNRVTGCRVYAYQMKEAA